MNITEVEKPPELLPTTVLDTEMFFTAVRAEGGEYWFSGPSGESLKQVREYLASSYSNYPEVRIYRVVIPTNKK